MGEKIKSYTDRFSKEEVELAYQTGGNYTAAGELLGICRGSVKTLCEKFGIKTNPRGRREYEPVERLAPEKLKEAYDQTKGAIAPAAEILGVSPVVAKRLMVKCGILKRETGDDSSN